jgi:hypothetical protein
MGLEPVGDRDHPVLGQRPLGDRRLVECPLDLAEQSLVDPVRADRAHRPRRRVVEQRAGSLHRGQPAERLAGVVVELAGLGRLVELGDQAGEDLDCLWVCGYRHLRSRTRRRPPGYPRTPRSGGEAGLAPASITHLSAESSLRRR